MNTKTQQDYHRRMTELQTQLSQEEDASKKKRINHDIDVLRHRIEIERIKQIKKSEKSDKSRGRLYR